MTFTSKKHLGMYAVAAILVAVAFTFSGFDNQSILSIPGVPQNEDNRKNTMSDTIKSLKMEVNMPKYLPDNVEFNSSYVSRDGKSATIIFSNEKLNLEYYVQESSLDPIKAIDTPTNDISITVEKKGEIISTQTIEQKRDDFTRTTINGVDAILVHGNKDQPSKIVWYDNGIFYAVTAKLPDDELSRIANSTQ